MTRKGGHPLAGSQQSAALKRAFLDAYAELGTVTGAAEVAGIQRDSHYRWLHEDETGEYRAAFVEAEGKAADSLEQEARRRAVTGTEKPVFQGGVEVGRIREFSDTLLIFLLKGARPMKYRDRVELTLDIRREAERLAGELGGVTADEIIAEAERIAREGIAS